MKLKEKILKFWEKEDADFQAKSEELQKKHKVSDFSHEEDFIMFSIDGVKHNNKMSELPEKADTFLKEYMKNLSEVSTRLTILMEEEGYAHVDEDGPVTNFESNEGVKVHIEFWADNEDMIQIGE